jgi:3-oxoacyl-ACP reductase-like protein
VLHTWHLPIYYYLVILFPSFLDTSKHDNGDSVQTEPKVLARYDRLGLDRLKREEIGRRCKQIIDQGRCDFVVKEIGLENCQLIYYVDPSISLENVALFSVNTKPE